MIGPSSSPPSPLAGLERTAKETRSYTHGFHPWAAKYNAGLARALIERFSNRGALVLDPFCGSGTTLVEAKLEGRVSVGFDVNPLAALISRVKVTPLTGEQLGLLPMILSGCRASVSQLYSDGLHKGILDIGVAAQGAPAAVYPEFPNLEHWFEPDMLGELAAVKGTIDVSVSDTNLRDFLLVAFSAVVVPASRQESETRYAAVSKRHRPFTVPALLERRVAEMMSGMREFSSMATGAAAIAHCHDAREKWPVASRSVDLVLTSPPYANTYDYYLYHKLRMVWLGMDWEGAKRGEIGSRNRHSSMKEGISTFVDDMALVFGQCADALAKSGRAVIVIGDSVVAGVQHDGRDLICKACEPSGFRIEDSYSYPLDETSKTFNKAFRQAGKQEHVIVLGR